MSERILVVDDADDVRQWLRLALESRGWTVEAVDSGAKALAVFDADDPPDAVVLDHMMPGMNGVEVAEALRGQGYEGPLVLFSAYLSSGMGRQLRELRITPVSKVDHTALFRVIEAAVRG
ncbi:MAG TPA: response regulator [Acidimicrobiales bacterium]